MVKFIDMTWIADKSLDLYCERTCGEDSIPRITSYNTKSVSKSVTKIFEHVFSSAIGEYSTKYELVLVAVPCFPITRMSKIVMMSRFLCNHSDFLYENGISSSQYQETFEKFVQLKCKSEYVTKVQDNVYLLNGRGILLKDWKDSVIGTCGSSLVNCEKDGLFSNNPNFIINFEFGDLSKFTTLPSEEKFKIDSIIENLTKNQSA